ncbi:MAG: LysM peptidoglycan-binding domain-containing protein [Ilumatobacteraceae bacterium]
MFGFGELNNDFDYDGDFDFTKPLARDGGKANKSQAFSPSSHESDPVDSDPHDFWAHEPTRSLPRMTSRRKPTPKVKATRVRRNSHRSRSTSRSGGTRQHGDPTQQIPVIDANGVIILDDTACRPFDAETGLGGMNWGSRDRTRPRTHRAALGGENNPLLRRIGAMMVLLAFGVPVAMALRGGDTGRDALGLGDAAAIAAAQASASTVAVAIDPQTGAVVEAPLVTVAAAAAPETQAPAETPAAQQPAAQQAVVAAPVCVKTYNVVMGDGWMRIADAHGVTLNELLASNAANVSTFLMAGATICVPAHATDPTTTVKVTTPAVTTPAAAAYVAPFSLACAKSYTVVVGDGWLRIANRHGVTMKEVLKVNAASASTFLLVGRKICVPANSTTPTVPTTVKVVAATPTTKKPRPAPTPTINPPTRTYTYAEVEAIIREIWPDDLETEALRIAHRESRLNPRAQNYCCYGLFQIYFNVHKKWLAEIGITSGEQLLDPYNAAKAGLRLYQRSGWGPWKL